jgi:hypothetical protein
MRFYNQVCLACRKLGKGPMPRTLRLSFLACAITYCAAFWCAAAQAETRYQSVCFELHKSGSFFSKTIKEGLGSNEGKFVLKAICTYLTGNKPACSSSVDAAGEVYNRLTKHRGSDFYGMIAASPGYQVCRAFFVTSDWSATTDTDANMLIHSSRDKLGMRQLAAAEARVGGFVISLCSRKLRSPAHFHRTVIGPACFGKLMIECASLSSRMSPSRFPSAKIGAPANTVALGAENASARAAARPFERLLIKKA